MFCELYAGGKYNTNAAESYEFSLGLNGLGLCATQYASEYMDVEIYRDGFVYTLHFEKGENVGGLIKRNRRQKADRYQHPLEAGPGGVHRHRMCRRITTRIFSSARRWSTPAFSSCCAMRQEDGSFDERGVLL